MSSSRYVAGVVLALAAIGRPHSDAPATAIKLDQAGYLRTATKIALVVSDGPVSAFVVRRARDGAEAYRGVLAPPVNDPDTGDGVRAADFTTLQADGGYYLDVPGAGRSWNFEIASDVYRRAYYLAARSFYGQRCGIAVDLGPEFRGYRHAACHLAGAYHPSSGRTGSALSRGGWHDAGDYGRYVVNSGIATGTLLWAWELFAENIQDIPLKIPESGNGIPDLLNEIRWNLDWMLSMQDEDGGAWHKQTSERFSGFVLPEKDHLISYIIGTGAAPYKSSCATGDLAAVAAVAARVYRPFDAPYADRCLRSARRAWTWLDANPNVTFRNPPGITTGEYGDADCRDERLWAAAELWRTTREPAYARYLLEHYAQYLDTLRQPRPEPWASVAPMALWTTLLSGGPDRTTAEGLRVAVIQSADEVVARTRRNPYRQSLSADDYVWGSNGIAANYGMALLIANAVAPDRRYVESAIDNLHYLLGRNTFSLSWVTQVGEHAFRHPHHRPSGAQSERDPWPGLLAGGPNRNRQDAVLKALPDLPPAHMYVDEQASYASNEVAINWNASLVFVLAGAMGR